MQGSLLDQGVELMLYGMGTVLAFLTVLVLSIALMSWVIARYFPVVEAPAGSDSSPRRSPAGVLESTAEDANLVAVISAAIHRHRSKKSP